MKQQETYLTQDPFDAAMARWERRLFIVGMFVIGFAASYFAPVVIRIFFK